MLSSRVEVPIEVACIGGSLYIIDGGWMPTQLTSLVRRWETTSPPPRGRARLLALLVRGSVRDGRLGEKKTSTPLLLVITLRTLRDSQHATHHQGVCAMPRQYVCEHCALGAGRGRGGWEGGERGVRTVRRRCQRRRSVVAFVFRASEQVTSRPIRWADKGSWIQCEKKAEKRRLALALGPNSCVVCEKSPPFKVSPHLVSCPHI